jgi:hypothetical protein
LIPNGKALHHFGFAAVCWALWKSRNKAVFEKKIIKHLAENHTARLCIHVYWAGLFTPELQVDVAAGVDTMLAIAHKLLKKKPDVERLQTGEDVQSEDGDEARLPSIRWKKH